MSQAKYNAFSDVYARAGRPVEALAMQSGYKGLLKEDQALREGDLKYKAGNLALEAGALNLQSQQRTETLAAEKFNKIKALDVEFNEANRNPALMPGFMSKYAGAFNKAAGGKASSVYDANNDEMHIMLPSTDGSTKYMKIPGPQVRGMILKAARDSDNGDPVSVIQQLLLGVGAATQSADDTRTNNNAHTALQAQQVEGQERYQQGLLNERREDNDRKTWTALNPQAHGGKGGASGTGSDDHPGVPGAMSFNNWMTKGIGAQLLTMLTKQAELSGKPVDVNNIMLQLRDLHVQHEVVPKAVDLMMQTLPDDLRSGKITPDGLYKHLKQAGTHPLVIQGAFDRLGLNIPSDEVGAANTSKGAIKLLSQSYRDDTSGMAKDRVVTIEGRDLDRNGAIQYIQALKTQRDNMRNAQGVSSQDFTRMKDSIDKRIQTAQSTFDSAYKSEDPYKKRLVHLKNGKSDETLTYDESVSNINSLKQDIENTKKYADAPGLGALNRKPSADSLKILNQNLDAAKKAHYNTYREQL
jgi:hypothetical protein